MARPGDKMTMIIVTAPWCTRVNALLERKKASPTKVSGFFFARTHSMRVMEDKSLYGDVRKGDYGINI